MEKIALVTGSSRGIGRAIARELAREGWRVCINYRVRRDCAESLMEEITAFGGEAMIYGADVAVREEVNAMVKAIEANEAAMQLIKWAWDNGKYVAAICAGPTVLADLGIVNGKQATGYPGCEDGMADARMIPDVPCMTDGKLITGTSAGCAIPFGLALIEALKGKAEADRIATQIVIR